MLKSICQSKKLSKLKTDGARLLYTWLIPNVDINGCFSGEEDVIKGQIFTRLNKTTEEVAGYLKDLEDVGLIIWYEPNGDKFLLIPDFTERQPCLNPSKEAKPTIPLPTPDLLQTYSGLTPPKVKQSEAKESKDEGKKSEEKAKVGSSFLSKDRISSASEQLKFYDATCELFGVAGKSDRTTLQNVAKHLSKSLDGKVFDKAWRVAQECQKTGDKPIALFISRMQDEYGYRRKVAK